MTTQIESYHIRIKELKQLQEYARERIKALQEESGIAPEEKIQNTIEDLGNFINDRMENEDVHTLWEIFYELNALTNAILKKINSLTE